jgi:hypothetical protein
LLKRSIRYVVDGGPIQFFEVEHSKDYAELILAVLRRTPNSVTFLPTAQTQRAEPSIEHRLLPWRQGCFTAEKGKVE